MKFICF